MEPWKTYIGDGNGVLLLMRPEIANGAMLTDQYIGTIDDLATIDLPNQKIRVAESLGIFSNVADKKIEFYQKIKSRVFRLDVAEYVFDIDIYYNPTLDQETVLQYLQENDFNTFLTHVDTVKMTTANGSDFLQYLL